MSKSLAPRAAALAALSLVLSACLVLGLHSRAGAEDPAVPVSAAPDLNWGFKETWRNYAQQPQVGGGATVAEPQGNAAYDLEWTFESGSYDPATQTTQLNYSGSAHWQKYKASELGRTKPAGYTGPESDPYLLDVTLSDPRITISKESSVLTVVATSRNQDSWELISYGRVPIVNLDVLGITPTVAGGTTTWAGITATVTAEGSAAMASNYRVGQVVDAIGFSYSGPGGAPDFSEHWDQPGAATLKLVQNTLFLDGDEVVDLRPFWIDRKNLIVHSVRDLPGSQRQIQAFDLEQMQPVGTPLVLPSAQAPDWSTNVTAYDTSQDRLLYRQTGESGMPRWFKFNPATAQYESGLLGDPQMSQTAFIGANSQRLVWDPIRNRGYRVQRIVPAGVGATEYDKHEWTLFAYAEGEDGVWSKKAFKLPSFPTGQNQTGFPTTSLNPANYAVASDGSLIALASTRSGLAATEQIAGAYRIVFNEADDAVSVQPLPGVEVLNTILAGGTFSTVQTSANGHILLVRMAAGGEVVHCKLDGQGGVGCDDPVSIRDNVEAGPYDEWRYALDSGDGTVWFGGVTSQKLAAVKDGAFAGGQFFQQRHPRGGPVLAGDDHFVYAQTNDGSAGESGGSKTWGYGKFERLGFVPTVTAQPQPDAVALAVGEASEAASFGSAASGEPAPQRQWQVKAAGSNKFVDLAGETGPTLSVAATRSDDGAEYRAVYSNAAGKVASDAAALAVEYAPLVRQSPANVKVLEGADAEFAVLADGKPEPTVTWQRRVGGFWENVGDEDESIVVDGNSLSVLGTNPDQSGAQFRARLTNALGTAVSEPAKLTVTPQVTIPPGGVDLGKVTLEWSGSAELQKAPPFGGSNYFSAGVSQGDEGSFKGHEGNAFVFQVAPGGSEAVATWATRADHVGGGSQLVRLYGGSGRVEGDGAATVGWSGSFSVNLYGGLAPFTLTDPVLTVDADGDGELSAEIDGCASSMANPSECNPLPAAGDVTVATFSGVEVDPAGELTVAPDYAGVEAEVPPGTAPQDRSAAGWGAWPQPFVDYHVQTGLAPYWYSSGGSFDPDKPPLPFTVDFAGTDPPVVDDPADPGDGGSKPQPPAPPVPVPPSVSAAKGAQPVGPRLRAKVATLSCPGRVPCTVKAPRNAPIRIGGRTFWAGVFAPATIPAGASATVRARLTPAALAALGAGRATLRVHLQVRSEEGLAKLLARVPLEAAG